jgi:hypothetical protein
MALVLLDPQIVSGASEVDFTTGIDSTYNRYEIWCSNVVPGTDAAHYLLRVSTDGGSTFKSGAADYSYAYNQSATQASGGANAILIGRASAGERFGNDTGENSMFTITLFNPSDSSHYFNCLIEGGGISDNGGAYMIDGSGT